VAHVPLLMRTQYLVGSTVQVWKILLELTCRVVSPRSPLYQGYVAVAWSAELTVTPTCRVQPSK